MKKLISLQLIIMLVLLLIPLASAQSFIFKQGEDVNFRFRCLDETNNYCAINTPLQISVEHPNGSNVLDNISMTGNPTFFNISLFTKDNGDYTAIIISPGNNETISEFTYLVNPTGFELQTSQGLLYIFMLIILLFLFILTGYITIILPWKNIRTPEGEIMIINWKKYAKLFCGGITYVLLVAIVWFSWNLSFAYFQVDILGLFLRYIFTLLVGLAVPIFISVCIIGIISYFHDKKVQSFMEKLIPVT